LNGSQNTKNNWLYPNNGSLNNPNWGTLDSAFLVSDMLDIGSAAKPALVDIDFDGDLDLVVGGKGLYTAPSTYESRMLLYKNTGTNTAPAFTLTDTDLANAGYNNLGASLSPTFGDLDGDFDPDMIVGTETGELFYYENTGSFTAHSFTYRGSLQSIDVGNFAAPALGDIDGDGDLDLLVGNELGAIAYYENTGSMPGAFTLVDATWAGIDMTSPQAPGRLFSTCFCLWARHNPTHRIRKLGSGTERQLTYHHERCDSIGLSSWRWCNNIYIKRGNTLWRIQA
jgi:hypothetical protein